ncbi:hypothetical protein [Amycolatopsis nalaikhensis]|uniref:Uncharacterized protein n=1 Tax=Amycolatopsis nalaikhensis TaxID=715472 RepID=A0ABY8XDN8_9PSEU|nr:hypothetical protein [Amycolatopsis sp. 2-2]WIV52982.1 hypothetical protein QP939_29065 [Amycolatopsis sp. 2-2]
MTHLDFPTLSAAASASFERFADRVAAECGDGTPITYAPTRSCASEWAARRRRC